jgi:hypothetical protein
MTMWTNSARVDNGRAQSTFAPRERLAPQELIDALANRVGTFGDGRSWTRRLSCSPRRDAAERGWLRSATAWE